MIDEVVVDRLVNGQTAAATMPERKAAIEVLLQRGDMSYSQIAARVGVHKSTVYRHRRGRRGGQLSGPAADLVVYRRTEVKRRYADGQSQRYIAHVLGISRAAVRQHMVVMGIQSRPRVSPAGREHWTTAPGSSYLPRTYGGSWGHG